MSFVAGTGELGLWFGCAKLCGAKTVTGVKQNSQAALLPALRPFFTKLGQPIVCNKRQLELIRVNGTMVRSFTFEAALNEIKGATRPLRLSLLWGIPPGGPAAQSPEPQIARTQSMDQAAAVLSRAALTQQQMGDVGPVTVPSTLPLGGAMPAPWSSGVGPVASSFPSSFGSPATYLGSQMWPAQYNSAAGLHIQAGVGRGLDLVGSIEVADLGGN